MEGFSSLPHSSFILDKLHFIFVSSFKIKLFALFRKEKAITVLTSEFEDSETNGIQQQKKIKDLQVNEIT